MSSYNENDLYSTIRDIVREETVYLRHYLAQVVDNSDMYISGRVRVTIPELGLISPNHAIWARPRQGHGMAKPKIMDWVEIYFLNGDSGQAVYLTGVREIVPMTSYTGMNEVLYQSPTVPTFVITKDPTGALVIMNGKEPFVKGLTLQTELMKNILALTQLKLDITAWVPVSGDGGASLKAVLMAGFVTKPLAILTDILSLVIRGK